MFQDDASRNRQAQSVATGLKRPRRFQPMVRSKDILMFAVGNARALILDVNDHMLPGAAPTDPGISAVRIRVLD